VENYTYKGSERYCYPATSVLQNKLGIKDERVLLKAEREITSIKLLMPHNVPIDGLFNLDRLSGNARIIIPRKNILLF
jgi:fido (protein-threonine AMPylation protein)